MAACLPTGFESVAATLESQLDLVLAARIAFTSPSHSSMQIAFVGCLTLVIENLLLVHAGPEFCCGAACC